MELVYPRTERLPWSLCIQAFKDSPGVVPSQDRMTPLGSFYARTEGLRRICFTSTECLPRSCSIVGRNDYPGVLLSWKGMTPQERFHPRTE